MMYDVCGFGESTKGGRKGESRLVGVSFHCLDCQPRGFFCGYCCDFFGSLSIVYLSILSILVLSES
jgi:hypothetical protein